MNEFQRRIGVGEPSRAFSRLAGTTRRRPVVMDDKNSRPTANNLSNADRLINIHTAPLP